MGSPFFLEMCSLLELCAAGRVRGAEPLHCQSQTKKRVAVEWPRRGHPLLGLSLAVEFDLGR